MQIIFHVTETPEEYLRREGHRSMPAPLSCPGCLADRILHRHGSYERGLSDLGNNRNTLMRVARFLCAACQKTVSLLPSFALPYRYVRVATVMLFMSGRLDDDGVQRWMELLRRYRGGFMKWRWRELSEAVGLFLSGRRWKDGREFWSALMKRYGDLREVGLRLVWDFGEGMFFRYVVHGWARGANSGRVKKRWASFFESE